MKALVIAAALAALSAPAVASAARDVRAHDGVDTTAAPVMTADAGRLRPASLTALHGGGRWTPAQERVEADVRPLSMDIEPGPLLVALGVLALAAARPLIRALRRHEQQRRATALASTLGLKPVAPVAPAPLLPGQHSVNCVTGRTPA